MCGSPNTQEALLSDLGLDVTITRREDPTFAPNGYIYNIYFDGATQDATNVPDPGETGGLAAIDYNDDCTVAAAAESVAVLATVMQGTTAGGTLSETQLPLGDIEDSSLEGT